MIPINKSGLRPMLPQVVWSDAHTGECPYCERAEIPTNGRKCMKTDVSRLLVTIVSGAALLGIQATAVGTAGARSWHETGTSAGYVQQAELSLGPSAAAHDDLGNSVALSADGHIALVGVPGRKVNGVDEAGAAEVFRFQGGVWGKPVQLDLGTAAASSWAGESVALSGDGKTAVLGAARVLEVFRFEKGSWNGPQELSLGAAPYGNSVSVSANGTAVVAGVQNGKSSAAEVFRFDSGGWSGPHELSLGSAGKSGDWFGFSVAMSGDGNTVLVGSPNRKVQGTPYAGAAYAFGFKAGHWSGPKSLTLGSRAAKDDSLGVSVALSADGKTPWPVLRIGKSAPTCGQEPSRYMSTGLARGHGHKS